MFSAKRFFFTYVSEYSLYIIQDKNETGCSKNVVRTQQTEDLDLRSLPLRQLSLFNADDNPTCSSVGQLLFSFT